ncbi:MAG: NAD(P)-dependent oxidoreductase [Cyanobacteria bacterium J06648_1]
MAKVTVLGQGAMGSRMAISLLQAGHQVTVWNRNANKTIAAASVGARVVDTPYSAVQAAEFVISIVRDDAAAQQVWLAENGALSGMMHNAIAIESSTLTVATVKELAQQFQQRGISFLDAPVAGTRPQAEAAQLIYFVGGEITALERAKPILQAMGSTVHYVGAIGNGMVVKLVVNSLFALQVSAMGELINLMHQSGLDKAQAVEVISATPVCSPAAAMAAKAIVARNFAPLFPIKLVEKDLNYALDSFAISNREISLIAATQRNYAHAVKQGHEADNITGIAQLFESTVA